MAVELHDLDELRDYVAAHGSLDGVVVQDIDLTGHDELIASSSCRGATFLGVDLAPATLHHVIDTGGVVFPDLPGLPFDAYRSRLYTSEELLAGWAPGVAGSFDDSLDMRIYRWASRASAGTSPSILDALARRLHDHAIDDALEEHLRQHPDVVAVMGGHGVRRTDPMYREVAVLGRSMARAGWHVATGGGPGAMEAANLGAWLAPAGDDALDTALQLLSVATDFEAFDAYLAAGRSVRDAFPDGAASLAVPTWFCGHEPTNQFATHIAKYFANSIREDGLLALATRGVVFAPGSAGTVQEVFQDATQNHYRLFSALSPMVFLDTAFWHHTMPAEPLLRALAGDLPYAALIGTADTADDTMAFLHAHPPLPT
jgi:predicted Rossmann-fold nucleotide-binding protein